IRRGLPVPGLGHLGEPAVHRGRQGDRGEDEVNRGLGAARVAAVDVRGALAGGPGGVPGGPRDLGHHVGPVAAVVDLGRLDAGVAARGQGRKGGGRAGRGAGGRAGRGGRRGAARGRAARGRAGRRGGGGRARGAAGTGLGG